MDEPIEQPIQWVDDDSGLGIFCTCRRNVQTGEIVSDNCHYHKET